MIMATVLKYYRDKVLVYEKTFKNVNLAKWHKQKLIRNRHWNPNGFKIISKIKNDKNAKK